MRVLWVSLVLLVLDQVTKTWVTTYMVPGEQIPVLGEWLKLTFTTNPGMAFGLTLGSKLFLTLFSVVATALIGAYLWMVRRGPLGYRLALACILGGAAGNIVDRVFYGVIYGTGPLFYGEVVDFIHVDLWRGFLDLPVLGPKFVTLFPIWNVADMSIVVGVAAVILLQHYFHRRMEGTGTVGAPAPLERAEALSTDDHPEPVVAVHDGDAATSADASGPAPGLPESPADSPPPLRP